MDKHHPTWDKVSLSFAVLFASLFLKRNSEGIGNQRYVLAESNTNMSEYRCAIQLPRQCREGDKMAVVRYLMNLASYCILLLFLSACLEPNSGAHQGIKTDEPNGHSNLTEEKGLFDIGDGGLLSGEPCAPPCFLGVIPGVTTEDEARDTLRNRGVELQQCKEFNDGMEGGMHSIVCGHAFLINFQFRSDVVDSVGFGPTLSLTVGDAIAKYGDPDAVVAVRLGLDNSDPMYGMALYYDKIDIGLNLVDQANDFFDVTPSTKIENVGYYARSSYEQTQQSKLLMKWEGYGRYVEHRRIPDISE
jgi:hypothetical protein